MRRLDNFDPVQAKLDSIETLGRDGFRLKLTEWLRFRHAIAVGNDASALLPQGEKPISEELKIEYQTLAKSHHQSVSHLVSAYQCLQIVRKGAPTEVTQWATYFRAQPEFYFHVGACLDGISRVAYILLTNGQKNRSDKMNQWGYASMRKYDKSISRRVFLPDFSDIERLANQFSIEGIYLIRNGITHGWQLPGKVEADGRTYWPEEIKSERFPAWP
ncbi:MAG: hypothetical protein ABSA59_17300 [Terriglobia bacterium]|jgi:hypothetical protein